MPRFVVGWIAAVAAVSLVSCSAASQPPKSNSTISTTANSAATAPAKAPVPTVLILDASGSMTTPDAPGPRIEAAKTAAKELVRGLPDGAQLGLVTYGTGTGSSDAEMAAGCQDVKTLVGLGPINRESVNGQIDAVVPSGYTPISLALTTAAQLLPRDGSPQAIVLVSDGEDTCGRPPCDVARELRQQHPGLAISTVGFRTDGAASEQLSCIATSTNGLFVQAANANQLVARLLATQNVDVARKSLSSTGYSDITLGSTAADIRRSHSDFPEVSITGKVVVVWADCDFTFADGALVSIAPRDGGRTIDGVAAGSNVSDAIKFYGDPVGEPTREGGLDWLVFTADEKSGSAYRMGVGGYAVAGGNYSGTIKQIVLCKCMPQAASEPVATFDGFASLRIGMTEADAVAALASRPGVKKGTFGACTILGENTPVGINVWIRAGRVTGIDTPAGTRTDRGVGDGSTPTDVRTAYSDTRYTIDEGYIGGQGSPAIIVYDGPNSSASRKLSFAIDGGRTASPSVGRSRGNEGC